MAIADRSLEVNMYSLSHAVAEVESQCRRELARAARPEHNLPCARRSAGHGVMMCLRSRVAGAVGVLVLRPARTSIADR
jgi:hypothetical protein